MLIINIFTKTNIHIFTMKNLFLSIFLIVLFTSCSNNSADDLVAPINQIVTYNTSVKAIIDNNCIGCHNATTPAAGLALTNYSQVREAVLNANLIVRINSSSNPMPPSGKMPEPTIDLVEAWNSDGLLE